MEAMIRGDFEECSERLLLNLHKKWGTHRFLQIIVDFDQ